MSRVARARAAQEAPVEVFPGEPPVTPAIVDVSREDRLRRILYLISIGTAEADLIRAVAIEFGTTPAQVRLDLGDIHDEIERRLDSEQDINQLMFVALGRAQVLGQHFFELATQPIPDRVVEVPAATPDEEPIYRALTAQERATLVQSKAAAAKTALQAQDFYAKLAGKRSVRWADKPQQVVHVSVNNAGLSEEDKELLKRLEGG